jgi:fructosamine-3-kinase
VDPFTAILAEAGAYEIQGLDVGGLTVADLDGGAAPERVPSGPVLPALPGSLVSGAVEVEPLTGGAANDVWLVRSADGRRLVLKCSQRVDPGLYPAEAEGLRVLAERGALLTPQVVEVSVHHLLLQAMHPAPTQDAAFWAATGRAIAGLHAVRGDRFGWPSDGWLGQLRQENTWTQDGHEFFANHRIRRYLCEPKVRQALELEDLQGLERICQRLDVLVPAAPSVLNHGDLYQGNVVSSAAGEPAFIDPAVCWMWAESDLSMMYCTGRAPESFFSGYQEVAPLAGGWRERMPLLHLRELLSVLAHFGAWTDCVGRVRDVIRRFA